MRGIISLLIFCVIVSMKVPCFLLGKEIKHKDCLQRKGYGAESGLRLKKIQIEKAETWRRIITGSQKVDISQSP